ncbi:class I SAM-dependent methyltransferase family protein [Candidatus Woesearchaeota archaeon]|nr:class I SAM-dependent methyltransferase family protein [Candidatus Woesearchaeota archaeon]
MKQNLKFYLKNKLTDKELRLVPSSFDVVGDILIFSDFPKELAKKEKIVGQTILKNYPHIKIILKKTKKYSGRFRTPKLKVIAGEKRKEAIHKENDVWIKLDVEKVYFSPRMSSERKRIAELIKSNESVLVMFSGSGAYPLVIAKNSKCKAVYGIEINPIAHKYALENVKKNKLNGKINLFLGDVGKVMPKLKKKFDRILMPLPKGGENFLYLALKYIKNKGVVHFYDFLHEDEFYKAEDKVKGACQKSKKEFNILKVVKCGQYSPRFYRVCVDFFVD